MGNLFENYFPESRVQIDYAKKGNDNFLVLCCQISRFIQVYKTRNKSTEQALLKLRVECELLFPLLPLTAIRNNFVEECSKMGVRVEHSSLYNPGSQSGVERSIGSLKHLLKRSANMNQ